MRLIDADALSEKLCETTIFIKDGEVFQRMINDAPTVSAEAVLHESCEDCPLYDHERHSCPRFNKVIPRTIAEAVQGEWLVKEKEDADGYYWWRECSNCGRKPLLDRWNRNEVLSAFCPYCGAKMGGDSE